LTPLERSKVAQTEWANLVGGQKGHKGHTLEMAEKPDREVRSSGYKNVNFAVGLYAMFESNEIRILL
jgi:hypothetical protein